MNDAHPPNIEMRRTRIGIILMLVSFALGMIVSVGSFLSMGGVVNTDSLSSQLLPVSTVLVGLLTPWAIVLEIVAIVLIFLDARGIGGLHRRLLLTAIWFLVVWGALNLGGFLPLTFMALQKGSLALLRAGQGVKAGAAILQYAIPFLLVFGIAGPGVRKILWGALVLSVVGNFSTVALGGAAMELQTAQAAGVTSYVPRLVVDYTKGVYPLLLGLGYAGGIAYIFAYACLLVKRRPS